MISAAATILMAGMTLVSGSTGNYIGVQVDNQYAYVVKAEEQTEYVNAQDGLYVRSEPHTDAEKLGSVSYASTVEKIGYGKGKAADGWSLIEWDGNYGWVCSDYIQEEKIEKPVAKSDSEDFGSHGSYLGNFMITAYEWTGSPCANGNYPSEGYTIACNSLPMGTRVYIEGVGERVVEDRGGGGSDWIDLYLGSESACWDWGVRYRDVWIVD